MTKVENICEEAGLHLAPLGPSVSVGWGGSHLETSRLLFINIFSFLLLLRIYIFHLLFMIYSCLLGDSMWKPPEKTRFFFCFFDQFIPKFWLFLQLKKKYIYNNCILNMIFNSNDLFFFFKSKVLYFFNFYVFTWYFLSYTLHHTF